MQKTDNLIIRFIEDSITEKEEEALKILLEKEENKIYFEEYIKINYLLNSKNKFDYQEPFKAAKLMHKKKRSKSAFILKYAAAILLLISTGLFFLNKNPASIETFTIKNNQIQAGKDKAILTLQDGAEIPLEKGQKYQTSTVHSNGENLIYNSKKTLDKALVYNYLTIPRGGQFFVKLSDGTKVWLNSESKIKYPVKFIENQVRAVELLYGEAYFEVSSSEQHKGSHFQVLTKNQKVDVLGTEFNIKAYKEEKNILTTLVEGKIALEKETEKRVLKPNEQSKTVVGNTIIKVSNVNTEDEISWKKGLFTFKETPLLAMMKILSRWYDATIIFDNDALKNLEFTGVLQRTSSIVDILKMIEETSEEEIKFEVDTKTIHIK